MSDTIYRQSAIDTLDKHLRMTDVPVSYPGIISALTEWLNELPSAQSEPSTEIQEILNYLDTTLHPIVSPDNWDVYAELYDMVSSLPPAQLEPCLDLIVSEIEETIRETKENGKRHDINIRTNGELICYGLQLALDIIEEKKNERIN